MFTELQAFHFLRPWALLLVLAGLLLPWLWRRSQDPSRPLAGMIAPHLLPYLLVRTPGSHRLRPAHLICALLVTGGLALAGPSWQRQAPAGLEEQAPLLIALELSGPSPGGPAAAQLERVKSKLQALVQRNPTQPIGLIAYAGEGHLVLPPTRDSDLLVLYLNALSVELLPTTGHNISAAVAQALSVLNPVNQPATLVLVANDADPAEADAVRRLLEPARLRLLMLVNDTLPAPQRAALAAFARASKAELTELSVDDDDLQRLERQSRHHFLPSAPLEHYLRWQDAGYWLLWPVLALALLTFRRGWPLHHVLLPLFLLSGGYSPPLQAGAWDDLWLSHDQQGRLAFQAGEYHRAATLFTTPYLKGLAYYRASHFDDAIDHLKQVDSANAWFYQGNSHARQLAFEQAAAAYQEALARRTPFPEASANLALVQSLASRLQQARSPTPSLSADAIEYDEFAGEGNTTPSSAAALTEQLWLDSLATSPADFLRQKFRSAAAPGAAP